MKRTTIIGLSLALAVALTAAVAFARGSGFGPGYGVGAGCGYPAIPNLTAEQSSKIQALQKVHLDATTPVQQELLKKKTELRSLWAEPNSGSGQDYRPSKGDLDS